MTNVPAIPVGTEENRKLRIRTARFSLGSAVFLCALKMVVGIISGSIGILASAIDNLADIFMSGVNLVSITKASNPADESHPYGHGKMETLGTLFQGGVIALTGVGVALEAARRLWKGSVPEGLGLDAGIFVMIFSMVASWFISSRIRRAGELTGSTALIADSVHFRMDVYSGCGILFSLVLFRFTGWKWLDPVIAMAVGAFIIVSAWPLIIGAFRDVLDISLPPDTVNDIERLIERHQPIVKNLHALRTRRSGSDIQVDFHVVMCREQLLGEAHRVTDHLENDIRELLGNAYVVSHIEPCDEVCEGSFKCEHMKRMIKDFI
ncbi:MAG: cation diffusion facilitator family transporter [Syntrophorhabdaceae bacterium]|nr:cation diffusion facilitator family transporter [Syntrophorhabdaceae bacterium]